MPVQVALKGTSPREIARQLKSGFDDLQETDSGWMYVQFDHPAWGREEASSTAARIPGDVIVSSVEPRDEADALVVVVGYVDSFTGDAHLGNGMVVPGSNPKEPGAADHDGGAYPSRRMPAVALFTDEDAKPSALIGSVHGTRESRFELISLGHEVDEAIREWLEEIVRQT
jgi:hypothetical protein